MSFLMGSRGPCSVRDIVDRAPLPYLELLVRNEDGGVYLARRSHRPAMGMWLPAGTCIQKNERLADAFKRLTRDALGEEVSISDARYCGLFEHIYPDSVFTSSDLFMSDRVSTHYIVNAFEVTTSKKLPEGEDYRWFTQDELLADPAVHQYTRYYFQPRKGYKL